MNNLIPQNQNKFIESIFENDLKDKNKYFEIPKHSNKSLLPKNKNLLKSIENKALNLFKKQKYNELHKFLINNIDNFSNNLTLLNLLGISQYKTKNTQQAFNTFKNILKFYPHNFDALNSASIILIDEKKWDEALIYLKEAIKLQPQNSSALNNLGLVYASKKKYNLSIKNFNKAIKIDNNFDAKRNLINVQSVELIEAGNYKKAEKILLKIIEENEKREKKYRRIQ